jgi:type I restriction enzyme, R subunit
MSAVGQREIRTQRCVIEFLRDALGYAYLGHWKDREGNNHIEQDRLT